MHVEEIIGRFQGVKKIGEKSYQCLCPRSQRFKGFINNYRRR